MLVLDTRAQRSTRASQAPSLSVVIPAFNPGVRFADLIDALHRQNLVPKEIIIVDDHSDAPVQVPHADMKVHRLPARAGAGVARHTGAALATGDIVAFIDSDCIPQLDWTERLMTAFQADPALGVIGGVYLTDPGSGPVAYTIELEETFLFDFYRDVAAGLIPGGNMAVRRSLWLQARSRREEIYFRARAAGDDTVLMADLRARGKVAADPGLIVGHEVQGLRGYLRRHVNRGYGGMTAVLNRLAPDEMKNNFGCYGGLATAIGTGLPWLIPPTLAAAIVFPGLWPWALLFAALAGVGSWLLVRRYVNAARRLLDKGVTARRLGPATWLAIYGMFTLRFFCWAVGAMEAVVRQARRRLGLYANVVASLAHFARPGRISRLFFFVTSQCNARCSFCFNLENVENWSSRKPQELTLAEVTALARKMKRLPYINLSGGEPFVRRDLADIVEAFYRHAHTQWVTIPTNAALTRHVIDGVREILVRCPSLFLTIQVSLDSIGEDHDRSRQIKGGFESLADTLGELAHLRDRFSNLRIQIGTVVGDFNAARLREISAYCKTNFQYDQQMFSLIRDKDQRISHDDSHLLSLYHEFVIESEREEWRMMRRSLWGRVVRALQGVTYQDYLDIKRSERFIRPCHATRKFATLYDDGQVSPCDVLPSAKLGNIRDHDYDLHALLHQREVNAFYRKSIVEEKCNCEWLCAIPHNSLYDPASYWRLTKAFFRPDRVFGR
jgi:MoaA/NifB/PqqE/SkfB family radical SAM enzyme